MTDLMNTLANITPDKKPTKRNAWGALRDVIKAVEAGEAPCSQDLAILYHCFRPAPPKRPKTWWQWVAKPAEDAAKAADVRWYLHYVHVTEDYAESTDGHRIHRVPASLIDAEPGYYHPTGEPLDYDPERGIKYPDTNRVWPGEEKPVAYSHSTHLEGVKGGMAMHYAPAHPSGYGMDVAERYATEATGGPTDEEPMLYAGNDRRDHQLPPLIVRYAEGASAIVMPVRI